MPIFGLGRKNKLRSFALENSKKEDFFSVPARLKVDGISRKKTLVQEKIKIEKDTYTTTRIYLDGVSEKEKFVLANKINDKKRFTPPHLRVDGIFKKEKSFTTVEEVVEEEEVDNKKRTFLKVAGATGLGLAAATLLPKSASAYVTGSTPTSNVVGVKNAANTRINPATEETVATLATEATVATLATQATAATLLKTSDLTFDAGSLQVKVTSMPSSGTSSFSDAGDVDKKGLVDVDRHLQVDVLSSSLPASASTETTLQTIAFGGTKYALRLMTVGSIDYIGEAAIGSATSSAVWRVKKVDSTTGISITWAGTGNFNQIWDNYASLTYT